jgi:hypothetical protein
MIESPQLPTGLCSKDFAGINEKLDNIDIMLRGNGEPGLKARVASLEKSENTRQRLQWLVVSVVVSLLLARVWSFLNGLTEG